MDLVPFPIRVASGKTWRRLSPAKPLRGSFQCPACRLALATTQLAASTVLSNTDGDDKKNGLTHETHGLKSRNQQDRPSASRSDQRNRSLLWLATLVGAESKPRQRENPDRRRFAAAKKGRSQQPSFHRTPIIPHVLCRVTVARFPQSSQNIRRWCAFAVTRNCIPTLPPQIGQIPAAPIKY
jgi:hypothetical protein